jgi:hypothetical protein
LLVRDLFAGGEVSLTIGLTTLLDEGQNTPHLCIQEKEHRKANLSGINTHRKERQNASIWSKLNGKTFHTMDGMIRHKLHTIWQPTLDRCKIAASVLHKGRDQKEGS